MRWNTPGSVLVLLRSQWVIAVSVLLAFGLLAALFMANEYRLRLDRERDRLLTQIRVIDANLTQSLEGVNAAILSTRPSSGLSPLDTAANATRSATLRVLADAIPAVRTLAMIDADGKVLASNRPEIVGFDASHRAYYDRARAQASEGLLHVAPPFTTALNVYALTLVKAWPDRNGRFSGATTATLDPEFFGVLLRSVAYAEDMRATLVHGDGLVLTTQPNNSKILGSDLNQPGTVFRRHLATGLTESFHVVDVALTGDRRMVAYRTVRPTALRVDKPLLLAVSRELRAVLAPWWQMAWALGIAYALVCALTLAGVYFLRRKHAVLLSLTLARERDAREQSERLKLALSGGNLGLFDLDLTTGIRVVNARAREIVGDGPDDPVDTLSAWTERRHPDDRDSVREARLAHQAGRTDSLAMDYRVKHKDGHWVWIQSLSRVTHWSEDGKPLRMVGTYLDITERKASEALIAEFAFSDPLTKLPNRRLLMDRLNQVQAASARSGKPAALLFMDLDRFKWVNDTLGHDMGDALLQEVSRRLQACVRQSDTIARLGGDEFVLLLDRLGDSPVDAEAFVARFAEKVLTALRVPVQLGGQNHHVTASIGATVFIGATESSAQLLKLADQALYRAKSAGRDRAIVFPDRVVGSRREEAHHSQCR